MSRLDTVAGVKSIDVLIHLMETYFGLPPEGPIDHAAKLPISEHPEAPVVLAEVADLCGTGGFPQLPCLGQFLRATTLLETRSVAKNLHKLEFYVVEKLRRMERRPPGLTDDQPVVSSGKSLKFFDAFFERNAGWDTYHVLEALRAAWLPGAKPKAFSGWPGPYLRFLNRSFGAFRKT